MNATQKRLTSSASTIAATGNRTIEVIASTVRPDRDKDVLLPSGILFGNFLRNPQMLLNHDPTKNIGKWTRIDKWRNEVHATGVLRDDTQDADDTWYAIENGFLNAVSVSFMVMDARRPNAKELRDFGADVQRIVTSWDLLEISIVTVPANPDALIRRAVHDQERCFAVAKSLGLRRPLIVNTGLCIHKPGLVLPC